MSYKGGAFNRSLVNNFIWAIILLYCWCHFDFIFTICYVGIIVAIRVLRQIGDLTCNQSVWVLTWSLRLFVTLCVYSFKVIVKVWSLILNFEFCRGSQSFKIEFQLEVWSWSLKINSENVDVFYCHIWGKDLRNIIGVWISVKSESWILRVILYQWSNNNF